MADERSAPVPVTIVGGYLGAGKTTLVNHLLRNAAGRRLAVLVNEFGELPIDADLIEADAGDMISLSGGCVCCTYGSDLMDALMRLPEQVPKMDGVLIEASGVALPGAIANALSLLPEYRLEATVVLVDTETVLERADDRYLGDTVTRQLADADIVLANKTDLVSAERMDQVSVWLARMAPRARVAPVRHARVPVELLVSAAPVGGHATTHGHFETRGFDTVAFDVPHAVDADALVAALAATPGLIRAKGFVIDARGALLTLQLVGQRHALSPAPSGARTGLVGIGFRGVFDRTRVRAAIAAAAEVSNAKRNLFESRADGKHTSRPPSLAGHR